MIQAQLYVRLGNVILPCKRMNDIQWRCAACRQGLITIKVESNYSLAVLDSVCGNCGASVELQS